MSKCKLISLLVLIATSQIAIAAKMPTKMVFKDPGSICSGIHKDLPFHSEFCQSVQQYSTSLLSLVQNLMGSNYYNYDVSIDISINEEAPVAPTPQNPDVDQTVSLYDNLKFDNLGIYPEDSFPFTGKVSTLGTYAGNFLSYLSQIQGPYNQAKDPFDYINMIVSTPQTLDPMATEIGQLINNMGAKASDYVFHYQYFQNQPYPLGLFQPDNFTADQFNKQTANDTTHYWGIAAGGGSGGGFTISINNPENVVLAGGMGGGGGFSSPGSIQYKSDNETVSSLLQTAAGSSAGGGLQFVADNNYSKSQGFTDGLGFGGGGAYGDGHDDSLSQIKRGLADDPTDPAAPLITYYPNATDLPVTIPVDGATAITPSATAIQQQFIGQLNHLKALLASQSTTQQIIVKGAGGMGLGAQLMYFGLVPGSTNEYRLQEYLPHAISTGASFTISIQLTPRTQKKLDMQHVFSSAEQTFYQNLDTYYTQANKNTMHAIAGKGGYLCSYYICKSNQSYIVNQAIKDFGSKDAIPSWLKIDTCSFQKDTDPDVCPTPPSSVFH